jgi:hypothetical protein
LIKLDIENKKNSQNEKRPHSSKDSKAFKAPKKNVESKKAATSTPPPAPVAAPVPAPVPAAPKKFSYADIVHRQRAPVAAAAPAVVAPTPAPVVVAVVEEEEEEDMEESESSESDYDYIQESDFPVHEKPFSWQSPSVTTLQNVLHWGRSSHGCINLVSS